jgi:hemerythrin-like domain-containing protein
LGLDLNLNLFLGGIVMSDLNIKVENQVDNSLNNSESDIVNKMLNGRNATTQDIINLANSYKNNLDFIDVNNQCLNLLKDVIDDDKFNDFYNFLEGLAKNLQDNGIKAVL